MLQFASKISPKGIDSGIMASSPVSQARLTIPNLITLFRIILTPLFIIFLIQGNYRKALVVFVLAGVSDMADGLIARTWQQKSRLGSYLDPLADKLLMAASFVNLETGRAFRVISTEESRALAAVYAPEIPDKRGQQLEAYKRMPDSVLFRVESVTIDVGDAELPGPTRYKVTCARCGQVVRDRREVPIDGRPYCIPCAGGAYFRNARPVVAATVATDLSIRDRCDGRESASDSRPALHH